MKGRYHLYTDESGTYSTNSYELFILYLKLFDYRKYKRIMYKPHWPRTRSYDTPSFPATHESFLKALLQEKRVFECGYIPERIPIITKDGKSVFRTRWVYSPEKAKVFLSESKLVKKLKESDNDLVVVH